MSHDMDVDTPPIPRHVFSGNTARLRPPPLGEEGSRPGQPHSGRSARTGLVAVPTVPADDASTGHRRLTGYGMRPLLVGADLVAVASGLAGAMVVSLELRTPVALREMVLYGVFLLLALWSAGLYRSRLSLSALDDLPTVAGRSLAAAALAAVVEVLWWEWTSTPSAVNWAYLAGAATISCLLVLFRALGYAMVRRLRSKGWVAHRTLILGAGRVGSEVAETLRAHPEYGLRPIGFLDADPPEIDDVRRLPVLGGSEAFTRVLLQGGVRTVVVAFSSMKESEMVGLIRMCDRLSCELFVVPRLFELHQVENSMDTAWGFPLVRLRRATYRSHTWRMKRALDVAVAGFTLLLLAPILALLAVAVRLDGRGDILFRQERVGVDGHHFQLLKFRSLRPATEAESATRWNVGDDPRLSRVGRFLRSTSLDELPQLYNILRGDMSLVGPRPERPHFVDQFRSLYPSYEARHRVPSGLTGWAQVHGLRGDTSIDERARFDNYYIENWSLWFDLKIMLRTVGSVLRGAGG